MDQVCKRVEILRCAHHYPDDGSDKVREIWPNDYMTKPFVEAPGSAAGGLRKRARRILGTDCGDLTLNKETYVRLGTSNH